MRSGLGYSQSGQRGEVQQYGKRHQENRNHDQGECRDQRVRVVEGKPLEWRGGAQEASRDRHHEVSQSEQIPGAGESCRTAHAAQEGESHGRRRQADRDIADTSREREDAGQGSARKQDEQDYAQHAIKLDTYQQSLRGGGGDAS
jgi:hypothetical protein